MTPNTRAQLDGGFGWLGLITLIVSAGISVVIIDATQHAGIGLIPTLIIVGALMTGYTLIITGYLWRKIQGVKA